MSRRATLLLIGVLMAAPASAAERISVQGIAAQLNSPTPLQLLDVRTPEEFAQGHIPGAINIPVSELAGRLQAVDRGRSVAVYCKVGGRAARAAQLLEQAGYDKVLLIEGSMDAWRAAGLPEARPEP